MKKLIYSIFEEFQTEVGLWADQTFPQSSKHSILKHLEKEIKELIDHEDFDNLKEECADIVMLLIHLAHKNRFNLIEEVDKKFDIVQKRKWAEPDEHGVCLHIKDAD